MQTIDIEQVKTLLAKFQRDTASPADKREAERLARTVGVTIARRRGCRNCYADALLQVYHHLARLTGDNAVPRTMLSYKYRLSVPVVVAGYGTYSNATSPIAAESLRLRNPQLFNQLFTTAPATPPAVEVNDEVAEPATTDNATDNANDTIADNERATADSEM